MTATRALSSTVLARSGAVNDNGGPANWKETLFESYGTSFLGNVNGTPNLLAAQCGGLLKQLKNTGQPAQTCSFIADRASAIRNYRGHIALLQPCRNDFGSSTTVAAAEALMQRLIANLLAAGRRVVLMTEYYSQTADGTYTTANGLLNTHNQTWLKNLYNNTYASDPRVIFFDAAGVLCSNSSPYAPLDQVTVTGTFTSGATTMTVSSADAAKLTGTGGLLLGTGMNSGASSGNSIVGVSGTTVTLAAATTADGSSGQSLTWTPSYMNPYHPNAAGSAKVAAALFTALQTAGWVQGTGAPVPSSQNDVTNLFQNGTLEGTVTSGVGTGLTSSFAASQVSVVADANFRGMAQQAVVAPGAAGGAFTWATTSILTATGLQNIANLRGKRVKGCVKVSAANFFECYANGSTIIPASSATFTVNGFFDTTPNNLVTTPDGVQTDTTQPLKRSQIAFNGQAMLFPFEGVVPMDASTLTLQITVSAVPAGAASSVSLKVGEVYAGLADDPFQPLYRTRSTRSLTAVTTILPSDDVVRFTAAAAISQPLPTAASMLHQSVTFKNVSTSAASLTLAPASGETIDGAASLVVAAGASARLHASAALLWEAL